MKLILFACSLLALNLSILAQQATEHAAVGDGASNLFAQLFGPETRHVRVCLRRA